MAASFTARKSRNETARSVTLRVGLMVACGLLLLVHDVANARLHRVAGLRRDATVESRRESLPPRELLVNGFLAYERPPEIEREACSVAVPKSPVRGRLTRAVVLAAAEQLNLPMGLGRTLLVRGRTYLFCLEPHFHAPGSGAGPEGWHKGVTVYHGALSEGRAL